MIWELVGGPKEKAWCNFRSGLFLFGGVWVGWEVGTEAFGVSHSQL